MDEINHKISDGNFEIQISTNRFTQSTVSKLSDRYPYSDVASFKTLEFNLEQVRMIDSTSIGYLIELNNKLKADPAAAQLVLSLGSNSELKELLRRFQIDKILIIS